MKKYLPWIFLASLSFILGLSLAIYYLQSQLIFGYDQARDAFEAFSIWHDGDLKIIGPSTDIPGVFHGVAWYYYLAGIYFLGRDPQVAAFISLLVSFLAIPLLGILTQRLFKDFRLTCLTIAIFVLSPLFLAFTRWMSNPSLALLITPLLLLSVWSYLQSGTMKSALASGIFFGLLLQAQFAYAVLLFLLPLFLWAFKKRPTLAQTGIFLGGLGLCAGSFILAEIKFQGQGISSIINFFLRSGSDANASFVLLQTFDRIFQMVSLTVLPWPKLGSIIFLVFLFLANRTEKLKERRRPILFLLIWLSGFVVFQFFSTAVSGSAHVFVTFAFPAAILFSYLFLNLLKRFKWTAALLLVIAVSQIATQMKWGNADFSPLAAQRSAYLSQELKLVDYTYTQANGKPFIINSITNPLYINTTWAYLYQFYGQPKYGYLPYWGGRGQTGRLGNLVEKPFGENLRFLIVEDTNVIPEFYVAKITYEEDKVSDIIDEKSFGQLKVQKRIFVKDKAPVPLPAGLKNVTPGLLK